MRKSPLLVMGAAIVAVMYACGDQVTSPTATSSLRPAFAHVDPVPVDGNPSCADRGYEFGLKVEPPNGGSYSDGFLSVTVTITETSGSENVVFDWVATAGSVQAVIVKGGDAANVYVYTPPAQGQTGDTGLHSPEKNGSIPGLSHIEFCYSRDAIILGNLSVDKTAVTHKDRDWTWGIEKTGDETELTLAEDQPYDVEYTLTVSATSQETNTKIDGVITITNTNDGLDGDGEPFNEDITVNSVSDEVAADKPATVATCKDAADQDVTLPGYVLAAGEAITCAYSATDWGEAPSGTNVATVNATRGAFTDDFEAHAEWDFANAELDNETDKCITVTDDQGTPGDTGDDLDLGEVCTEDLDANGEYTFATYTIDVGALNTACEQSDVTNTASFVTNDNEETGDDDHTVTVTENCVTGCTLTPGYWKTHADATRKQYDETWNLLTHGPATTFFQSGMSYLQVLNTSPSGNVYYILAHAYIAAQMNQLNGAAIPANVLTAFNNATTLLTNNSPAQAATLRGAAKSAWVTLALTLDNYNNGITGPGHCDEQGGN